MEVELVKKNGNVSMEKSFDYLCSRLSNGVYTLKIVRKTKPRTIPQNSLMWMWFKCMEEQTGQPKEDWHDYYVAKFLSRQVMIGNNLVWVPGRSSTLNSLQMTNFLNKVQADAATEWGITLPLPADRFFADFVDEYQNR